MLDASELQSHLVGQRLPCTGMPCAASWHGHDCILQERKPIHGTKQQRMLPYDNDQHMTRA